MVCGSAGNEASLSSNEVALKQEETDVSDDATNREYDVVVIVDEVGDSGIWAQLKAKVFT